MKQTSTPNLLLLHAYEETNLNQQDFLAFDLAKDENTQQELMDIVEMKKKLDLLNKKPSKTSIRIIMDYSHKTEHLHEI